jgi:O-antigen ligase
MTKDLINKIKLVPKLKLVIIIFAIWQYITVLGIALLGFSNLIIWINLGFFLAFILIAPVYESLLLLIISIPFYVALPNEKFDSFAIWRILFLGLFLVWFIRDKKFKFKSIHFLPWDKYLAWFAVVGLVLGLVFGNFKFEAVKQLIFYLNIYFFYIVLINTLRGRQQIYEVIRYVVWSITIIITLGFAQLFGTFTASLDVFWVFWASNFTKLYYGANFANVSLFSNSWFSYTGGGRDLRMFSIMPDSQSFAYICLIGLCIGTALTRSVFVYVRKWLWSGIRFAALGLILSGTRAVWVGMVLPFLAVAYAYRKKFQVHLAEKYLWPFIIIFALFAISPLINKGLSYFEVNEFKENFLERATSIYNFNESSNQGRIAIWKSSAVYFLQHPWGIGFGNFLSSTTENNQSGNYEEVGDEINVKYNLPAKYVSAHSLYLQVLVETGIIGFILFTMFWFTILKYFWHFIKNYQKVEDFLTYFVTQAFLMILWVLGAAFFDITLLNDKVLMFFFINIGLAGLIVKRYHEYEEIKLK